MDEHKPLWSIILAYYNEREFIEATLRSAIAQKSSSFRLILVDNRSTDDTVSLCRDILAQHPQIDVHYVYEDCPGHAYAMATGFGLADTAYVAFWDADTVYPDNYLATAERLLAQGDHILAQAVDVYDPPFSFAGKLRRWRMKVTQLILSRQGHTGFFGICAKTASVRAVGGPMNPDWPYVLEDHELIHRLLKHGSSTGSPALWCQPAPRRGDSGHVSWTLFEQLAYHLTPFPTKDWFFYRFLARRFDKRGLLQRNLRIRDW